MPNLNKVFLMGNLTRDPELRYTPSGTAVASFGIAINRRYRSQSGEDREDTCFVDATAFARQAEVLSEYMSKGRPIFVEGRLNLDQWEDKQSGQRRSKLTVIIENFQFIGGRQGDSEQPRSSRAGGGAQKGTPEPSDDDIPF